MKTLAFLFICIFAQLSIAQFQPAIVPAYLSQPTNYKSGYRPTPLLPTIVNPGQALLKSTDNGTTWHDLGALLPSNIQLHNFYERDGEFYLGTYDGKIYHSDDLQSGQWELELERKTLKAGIAVIFMIQSGVYANIYNEGLYRRTPGSGEWQPVHANLMDKTIFAMMEDEDGSILAAGGSGIHKTVDLTKTWTCVYAGSWATSLTYGSGTILSNTGNGVIRTTNKGLQWDLVYRHVNGVHKTLIIDDHFVILCPSAFGTTVHVSSDQGLSWQLKDPGAPHDRVVSDLVKAGDYLFSSRKAGLSRSLDRGKTWELILCPSSEDAFLSFEIVKSGTTLFAVVRPAGC